MIFSKLKPIEQPSITEAISLIVEAIDIDESN